jgi:putative ribosome small subunit-dependent GTPase A
VRGALAGHETVLVGHSGVGKSTLINALIPTAGRATGRVNGVTGKGRHTSTSAVSLALPEGGRIVDTPGVRGFGLAHVSPDDVLRGFVDLAGLAEACPRGCTHAQAEPDCALGQAADPNTIARVVSFRRLLAARTDDWS